MRDAEAADGVEAEAVCEHGDRRCWPGMPLHKRRQAQYAVIRDVWAVVAPGEDLPTNQINSWLCRYAPGDECSQVVDSLLSARLNHDRYSPGKPIKTPRKYFTDAMDKALDPDHGYKRGAQKLQRGAQPRKDGAAQAA